MTETDEFYEWQVHAIRPTMRDAYEAGKRAATKHTPDASLPPYEPDATKRRRMVIEIEVSADFEKRLDNQWEVEREINADRWRWSWPKDGQGHDLSGERLREHKAG